MSIVRLEGVSFRYSDHLPVLDDVTITLSKGWTGLVGSNGCGKSTFLRICSGELSPTAGARRVEPPNAVVAACPQRVDERTPAIEAFGWSWTSPSKRLQARLRLDPDDLERWETLSPGERKRWQVGAALDDCPDVLLLDEPTNHLDAEARDVLLSALLLHKGVGLVVSHDRALLDALTTRTLRLSGGALDALDVPYSPARARWERALAETHAVRDRLQGDSRRRAKKFDDARRRQEAADRGRRTSRRMKDANDSDARGILAQTKADWADASLAKRRRAERKRSEAANEALGAFVHDKELGRSVFARFSRSPAPFLAVRDAGPLVVGHRVLADLPTLAWGRADRVRVSGRNGAGKTTLLHAMLESLRMPPESLLWLPQNPPERRVDEAFLRVRALPGDELGTVMSVVAALGVDPARLLSTEHPSPGEARKLLLAEGLARGAFGLVLDEPTNHLDLPSVERLETALSAYPGAILLVTHDDAFARCLVDVEWRLEPTGFVSESVE